MIFRNIWVLIGLLSASTMNAQVVDTSAIELFETLEEVQVEIIDGEETDEAYNIPLDED